MSGMTGQQLMASLSSQSSRGPFNYRGEDVLPFKPEDVTFSPASTQRRSSPPDPDKHKFSLASSSWPDLASTGRPASTPLLPSLSSLSSFSIRKRNGRLGTIFCAALAILTYTLVFSLTICSLWPPAPLLDSVDDDMIQRALETEKWMADVQAAADAQVAAVDSLVSQLPSKTAKLFVYEDTQLGRRAAQIESEDSESILRSERNGFRLEEERRGSETGRASSHLQVPSSAVLVPANGSKGQGGGGGRSGGRRRDKKSRVGRDRSSRSISPSSSDRVEDIGRQARISSSNPRKSGNTHNERRSYDNGLRGSYVKEEGRLDSEEGDHRREKLTKLPTALPSTTSRTSASTLPSLQPPNPTASFPGASLFQGKQKIAFLFLVRGPLPLRPLWEWFLQGQQERASVYVHASLHNYRLNVSRGSAFWGSQVAGTKVEWGDMNMVRATRRLLASALEDPSNQRFVLVSESCIPIRSFDFIHSYLFAGNRSFLTTHPVLDQWRYPMPYLFWKGMDQKLVPPENFRKGSQWFALTRQHAVAIVKDETYYQEFARSGADIPDESYIQTIIPMLFPASSIEPRSVLYVQWPNSTSPHPRVFRRRDVTASLLQNLQVRRMPVPETVGTRGRMSPTGDACKLAGHEVPCFLFARKFGADALQPLLQMRELLGY